MKHYKFLILLLFLCIVGCSQDSEQLFYNDIYEYEGVWRDTIYSNNDILIEDIVIKDNSIKYILSDSHTHVVLDILNGELTLGNENKMGWICYAPITNTTRQLYWNVLGLTKYQMRLYSSLLGERVYQKVYYPSIDEYVMQDTLLELNHYGDYLPLSKDVILNKFGIENSLSKDGKVLYYVNHPLIKRLTFNNNYFNDSVYSYSLIIDEKKWDKVYKLVQGEFTKIRDINGTTEYMDSEVLANAKQIIITDSASSTMTFKSMMDYDYLPDVSHFMGMPYENAKDEYHKRYVYDFREDQETKTTEYYYRTAKDSVYNFVAFKIDSSGIVTQCGVELFKYYINKTDAKKSLSLMASLLDKKYIFDNYDDVNNIYYYHYLY